MSKRLKRKAIIMFAAELLCLAAVGFFLSGMQTRLAVKNQNMDMQEKIQQMQGLIDTADENSVRNTLSYDEVYRSKAASVAYLANKDESFVYTDNKLRELADMLDVTNLIIIDKSGKQIAKAAPSAADFTYQRYNQLRTVFNTNEPSEAFEVEIDGVRHRYYGAKIDGNTQVVIEQNPQELHNIQNSTSSWESILSKVSIGFGGYAFAISSQDYTFQYHPDEQLIGQDSLHVGLDVENLEDEFYGWMTINGEQFYCGVKYIDADNAYVICTVPKSEITASRNITVGIVLFIFFVVITTVIFYGIMLLNEQDKKEQDKKEADKQAKGAYFDKTVGKRLLPITVVGLLLVFIVSFYMQTLFSLSMYSISNIQRVEELQETLENNEQGVELITAQYNKRYLNKCQMAAYILSQNPQLQTREELKKLSDVLGVEFLIVFDSSGKVTVTDSNYVNFQLSDDPADQSYEFGKLLQGVEYFIQEAQPDEVSGEYHQYIASILYDESGAPNGFVQTSIVPDKLEEALSTTKAPVILNGVKIGVNGFAFAVSKEDLTFAYYPQERMVGKNAINYGLKEQQLRDGYNGYIKIDAQKYYGSCFETDTGYVYVVIPNEEMAGTRLPMALASAGISLIFLLAVFVILIFRRRTEDETKAAKPKETSSKASIEVVMPDGRVKRTASAASRWSNSNIKWNEKTAEQKITSVFRGMITVLALIICMAVIFKDTFFNETSVFWYVLRGEWERGVNVFALTGSIMIICVASVAVMFVRKILKILSKSFGARGETVCRLISSFVKYFSVIGILYYCLALFGVDTATLLASAGILSLVIGLGAKSLISDIIAGLFIIFEGEFQVGDIVTVGSWRGTVLEIGVRTTKIEDPGNNVKIISNSDVSGVINMTRRYSFTFCDVGIEYGESLERVENIIAKELPNIKKRLPSIKDGPFYKGVVSLGDNSVNIRIAAQCAEKDKAQLTRDLNREMKILFDKYDINIPFPQVVINQPKEYEKATELEKRRADKFNETQKELSKVLQDENIGRS